MEYTVPLSKIISQFTLEVIYSGSGNGENPEGESAYIDSIDVASVDINRPGLAFSGFYEGFDPRRIQIIGIAEHQYIQDFEPSERNACMDMFFRQKPVCVVVSSSLDIMPEMMENAVKHGVTLLRTTLRTSYFAYALIAFLNVQLAPRVTRHGVFVEVYGEGILMTGESGIGKSETAIELVKRGHRLIADDAVEIKRVSAITLIGSAPELIRHMIELRGIGLVDVRRIFGMGAVKPTEKIDLICSLEQWDKAKNYDRLGVDTEYTDILGIKVPTLIIPVRPGRNLAVILEIAAMNNRQKKMGFNTAEEFMKKHLEMLSDKNKH